MPAGAWQCDTGGTDTHLSLACPHFCFAGCTEALALLAVFDAAISSLLGGDLAMVHITAGQIGSTPA